MVSDAHIHLNALTHGPQVAQHAARAGACLLAVTCSPAEFACALQRFENTDNVLVGLGLHPWELDKFDSTGDEGDRAAGQMCAAFARAAEGQLLLGELGLDFHGRFAQSAPRQLRAFKAACLIAAEEKRVLSLHTRAAELEALQVLEDTAASKACTCILHGFAGGGAALTRALEAGCMFSLGPRQLSSRRGREYALQLPSQRLLLETDADASAPQRDPSPEEWSNQMSALLEDLSALRACPMEGQLEENWHRVFKEL